jgi:hypothetical protein
MTALENFNQLGFCVVRSAVSKELRQFITQYALFDEMQDLQTEHQAMQEQAQVPNAHFRYADPAMEAMLLQLQEVIEHNTQLTLFPTYSFHRVYRPGDELAPHKDRPSCEISATVCLGYNYENYQWPIYMEGSEVVLEPGDLVIYRGCDLEHWRNAFNPPANDVWHVQAFFHYVDSNGPHANWKYDKRPSIGHGRITNKIKNQENNMPAFKSTRDIFNPNEHSEAFDPKWFDSDNLVLPAKTSWDYKRELQIEDVNIWEVIFEIGSFVSLYAAWDPHAEFFLFLYHGTAETFYGKGAQKKLKIRLDALEIPYSLHKMWVDPSQMHLYE